MTITDDQVRCPFCSGESMTQVYLDDLRKVEMLEPMNQFIHEMDCPYIAILFRNEALQSLGRTLASASSDALGSVLQRQVRLFT